MLPVVVAAAVDLRRFAHALDAFSNKKVDDSDSAYGSHLERVAQAIMKLFQICAADRLVLYLLIYYSLRLVSSDFRVSFLNVFYGALVIITFGAE